MGTHYYLLCFVDKKAETSYPLRGKTKIWPAGYKAPDSNHPALYHLSPVEQTIYIISILGNYIQWLSPKDL